MLAASSSMIGIFFSLSLSTYPYGAFLAWYFPSFAFAVACNTAVHVADNLNLCKLFIQNARASTAFVFRAFNLICGRDDAPN